MSVGEHFLGASGHRTCISIWFYALNFLLFKCSLSRSSQPSPPQPLGCCCFAPPEARRTPLSLWLLTDDNHLTFCQQGSTQTPALSPGVSVGPQVFSTLPQLWLCILAVASG